MLNKSCAVIATALLLLCFGTSAGAQCPDIGFVQCDSQPNGILVTWNPPANSYSNLNVVRNGQVVAQLDGQALSFLDTPGAPGVYTYQVTADCGATSFACQGQTGVEATYTADHVTGAPGTLVEAHVRTATQNCNGVTSGSFGLRYDSSLLTVTEILVSGSLAALNFSGGPGLQFPNANPAAPPGVTGVTFGFVTDISPPLDQFVPVGMNEQILTVRFQISPNAQVGESSTLEFTEELGSPTVAVRISVDQLELSPTSPPESGSVTVLDTVANVFVRGDANLDGNIAILDGILVLSHLFLGEPINCENSADFTDDGVLSILDGIQLLSFLFLGGSAPAAPYPNCGMDPTSGSLDCEIAVNCQ